MKQLDRECKRLADIQAELFELSTRKLEMSSEVFVRRFMNSKIVKEMDDYSFLDDSKTIEDIFKELDQQYGKTTYGSIKYNSDSMYWVGYLYRCFSYIYIHIMIICPAASSLIPTNDRIIISHIIKPTIVTPS